MSNIKLSVAIVAYKNIDLLKLCLDSLDKFNDAREETEIIIVDNSPDMSVFYYVKEHYKWVRIIKSDNNGFGAGNNVAVINSMGEYLLFLNPDTIFVESIFRFIINIFESNNKVVMLGIKLLNRYRKSTYSFFWIDRFGLCAALSQKFLNKLDIFIPGKMHLHGACMFVRKKDFIEAGMFDEKIFMYEEEADLTKRIMNINKQSKIRYYRQKRLIHLEGSSSPGIEGEIATIKRLMITEQYYCKKYQIDFQKRVKTRMRWINCKYYLYKILGKEKRSDISRIRELYMSYLN